MTDQLSSEEGLAAENARLRARLAVLEGSVAAARQAEERFTRCVEGLLDCFGIFTAIRDESGSVVDFRVDYLNAAACRNNGMPLADQLGRTLCELLPAHRVSGLLGRYVRVVETGEPLELESLEYEDHYAGKRMARAFDIRAFRLEPDVMAASWRDVTGQRAVGQAVAESEARYRTRFESLPLIAWVNRPDGTVDYFNARWMEYTGLPARGDVSRWLEAFSPEDRERIRAVRAAAIAKGEGYEVEAGLRRHDGAWRWHVCRVVPLRGTDGSVFGWLGTATDIEDRRRAEAVLRENEAQQRALAEAATVSLVKLRGVLEAMTDGVAVADPGGTVTAWNAASLAMHGYPPDGDMGRHLAAFEDEFELSDPETGRVVSLAEWPLARVMAGGRLTGYDLRVRRRDGSMDRVYSYAGTSVRDARGQVVLHVLTIRDVSERAAAREALRRAREAAEDASRAKDQFLAVVSHELRTPLSAIVGWTQLLQAAPPTPEDLAEGIETIHRNALQQAHVVDDLLDVSRIVTGKLKVELRPVDLTAVVRHGVGVAKFSADAKGVGLKLQAPEHPVWVDGDGRRLDQVITNLLSNAIKFTPADGLVSVCLGLWDGTARLTVTDTGCGIPEELLSQLFTRFTQARSGQHGGLGLGLAIARHLAELHRGTLTAESPGIGRGATFVLRLPLRA